MPTFNTVSEVEAYIAFKRCTAEFLSNLRASIEKAERDLAGATRRFEAERSIAGWAERINSSDSTILWHFFKNGKALCGRDCADAGGPYLPEPLSGNVCPYCNLK